mgnify:CR=1 FL=1
MSAEVCVCDCMPLLKGKTCSLERSVNHSSPNYSITSLHLPVLIAKENALNISFTVGVKVLTLTDEKEKLIILSINIIPKHYSINHFQYMTKNNIKMDSFMALLLSDE